MGLGKLLLRRKAKRYKREAINKWRKICAKYEMSEFMSGENYAGWCEYPADKYGWAKARASGGLLGFIAGILDNPLSLGALALGVVGGAIIGGILGNVVIAANAVSFVAMQIYAKQVYRAELNAYFEMAKAYSLTNISEARKERAANSEALSKSVIYGGYDIYANGAVYNNNRPGRDTNFLSGEAFDTTKGIYGNVKTSPLDEMVQNRNGLNLAGGEAFHSLSLKSEIPLAKSLNERDNFTMTKEAFHARALKSQECFNELIKNGYGLGLGNDFLKRACKKIDELTLLGYKINLKSWDFLEKNKAYNKALMREFDTLELKHFKSQEEIEAEYKEHEKYKNEADKAISLINKKEHLLSLLSDKEHYYALNGTLFNWDFKVNEAFYKMGEKCENVLAEILESFETYKDLSKFVDMALNVRIEKRSLKEKREFAFYVFENKAYFVEFSLKEKSEFIKELESLEKNATKIDIEKYYKEAKDSEEEA
ncbi:putative membrane protein [Campylobacter vulpis]|uniref:hypothetical protein n=1 Tax=Campylobacter vulpis TaxID=1655500 RepID=UPI000C152751|nr:hypothetical protein [Campylobacter vulpis]MBS4306830.1 hypothetical protein [Campylobacter vulpis]PHY89928.1 hypothetical protein AA995_07260 [Campylobacter vulpis]QNF77857.1 putative membrane protein [Campylobacter vulpis]